MADLSGCGWHKDEEPVQPGIGCEYCSTMLSTKTCEGCDLEFLDWEDKSFDDIIAGPYVSLSGDLMCMRCGPSNDSEREQAAEDEYEYDFDYDGY